MKKDIEPEIMQLEQRAMAAAGNLLQFAPRAFVIEFAGTPKAGKSTSVEAIRHFFARHGFRVHVLVERASVCPIPMKGHLFFNTWCAATMLAELIANVDTETDIIIIDRGLFDALVWLTLQNQRGELTHDEKTIIEAFLLLDRWRTLIDLAVVMNVSAHEAMMRENSQRISQRAGSIMNTDVLKKLSEAVETTVQSYGPKFRAVVQHETSGEEVRLSNARLAGKILDHLDNFLDPEILVVPKRELDQLPLKNGGSFSEEAKQTVLDCITEHGRPMRRAHAEADPEVVQIVACGLLTHNDEVFLFERKERDPKYRLYGKATIWQGAHVLIRHGERGPDLIKNALVERVTRSLFLSRMFPIDLVGYCWDPVDEKSNRHFGVVFRVGIDNDHTASDLRKKEFRRGRGHGVAGRFVKWNDLSSDLLKSNLESWSLSVLNGLKEIRGLKGAI